MLKRERYQKGYETLQKLTGDIYSRPALDLKQRELITLTSLITQGAGERQLIFHFKAALHIGWSLEELIEIIIHCAAYSGFPRAAFALEVLQQLNSEKH
jgi:4-carboxymuconolactone decarboxylase